MDWHYLNIIQPLYARRDTSRVIFAISTRKQSFKDRRKRFTVRIQYQNCNLNYLRDSANHSGRAV